MRIFLVRHGESLGNVDAKKYAELGDHHIPLTQFGYEQALDAGRFLCRYLQALEALDAEKKGGSKVVKHDDAVFKKSWEVPQDSKIVKVRTWYAPFTRTTQTKDAFLQGLAPCLGPKPEPAREDYLLREQDFGLFSNYPDQKDQERLFPEQYRKFKQQCETKGKCYAVPPDGESRLKVAERTRLFKSTVMRDVLNKGVENMVIIGHGVTNRAFEMDFLHKGVKWFEDEPNPDNCDIVMIEGDHEHGYTATQIYKGKPRLPSMPEDYKKGAYPGIKMQAI